MQQSDLPWILLLLFFISSVTAFPREIPEEEVPPPVLQRFRSTYPEAKDVEYRDEHMNPPQRKYQISYEMKGRRHKTIYSYNGLGVVEDRKD